MRLFEPYALDLSSGVATLAGKGPAENTGFMRAVRLAGKRRENCDE